MQTHQGRMEMFEVPDDLKEQLASDDRDLKEKAEQEFRSRLNEISQQREKETGKPHPVFEVGEIVFIKGGKFKITKITHKRLYLKPMEY